MQGLGDGIWVIAMIKQNGDFGDVDRLGSKVIQVVTQQFNQALVVGQIGFGAVSKKRQTQSIDSKMAFDAISTFVMTKPFGLNTGIARIFYRL